MDTKSGEACSRVSSVSTAGERRVQSFMRRQIARVSMQSRCHRNGQKFGDLKIPVTMKITTQNAGNSMRRRHRWTSPRVLSRGAGCRRTMISDRSRRKQGRSRFRRMDSDRAASVMPICALSNTRAASSLVRKRPEKRPASEQTHLCSISAFSNLAYCMRAGAALSMRSPVRVQEAGRVSCRLARPGFGPAKREAAEWSET